MGAGGSVTIAEKACIAAGLAQLYKAVELTGLEEMSSASGGRVLGMAGRSVITPTLSPSGNAGDRGRLQGASGDTAEELTTSWLRGISGDSAEELTTSGLRGISGDSAEELSLAARSLAASACGPAPASPKKQSNADLVAKSVGSILLPGTPHRKHCMSDLHGVPESSELDVPLAQIEEQQLLAPGKESALVRRRSSGSFANNPLSRKLTIDRTVKCMLASDNSDGKRCSSRAHPAQGDATPGAMVSIWGSTTTKRDKFIPFFGDKPINSDGELSLLCHRVGLLCHRGKKPESPNQDDFFVLAREGLLLLGVLDGHGPEGHEVSHYGQEHLPRYLMDRLRKDRENWQDACSESFAELITQMHTDIPDTAFSSGATTTVLMLDSVEGPKDAPLLAPMSRWLRLRCAFVGDSSCVYARRPLGSKDQWEVTTLTDIHRPDREDETERIHRLGGCVQASPGPGLPSRLMCHEYDLAMSRAIGDFHAKSYGLSHQPEITPEFVLGEEYEHLILVCSDGIWDVIPPTQAVQFVGKFKPEEAQLACEKLVAKATLRWQEHEHFVDDITAIILWPRFGTNPESSPDSPISPVMPRAG